MAFLSNLFGGVASFATGRLWQIAAIGLLATLVSSSSYLGYQWYHAASERNTAQKELAECRLKRAGLEEDKRVLLASVSTLKDAIDVQNKAISVFKAAGEVRAAAFKTAMARVAKYESKVSGLQKKIDNLPSSTTCDEAIKRQHDIIDNLNKINAEEVTQ